MKRVMIIISITLMLAALLASCGDKTTTTPAATATAQPTTTEPADTTAAGPTTSIPQDTPTPASSDVNENLIIASTMADFFYDLNAIQDYYSDGLAAMAGFKIGAGTLVSNRSNITVQLVSYTSLSYNGQKNNIPSEFSGKLPAGGSIPAPPGACPAAAAPASKFITQGGDIVTPDLLADKDINILPTEWINVSQDNPGSLFSVMSKMVPVNDRRLADPEGWNTLLWEKIKEMQVPAESLMDYQTWNTGADVERQIIESLRQSLINEQVPQTVIDAFDASDKTGWYSSTQPTGADALAKMDITAEMTGSVSGTVHEWRDFSISGMGESPEFGPQMGDGTVIWEHPALGPVEFSVDILLDMFDEQGRAINGHVVAEAIDFEGYRVEFTFLPDGSKEGVVLKDGELVGYLTMTVDHDKFENYIDIKEGTEIKLPESKPEFTHFQ